MRADDPSRAITDHHVGLGASSRLGRRQNRQETLSGDFTTRPKGGGPDRTKARVGRFSRHDEVKRSLTVLIFSGVLERFPRLKIVSAENNVSWLPFVIQRWDQAFEAFRYMYPTPLALPPQRILPPAGLGHLHRRSARRAVPPRGRHRPCDVVVELPAAADRGLAPAAERHVQRRGLIGEAELSSQGSGVCQTRRRSSLVRW